MKNKIIHLILLFLCTVPHKMQGITYLFAHGLADTKKQAYKYTQIRPGSTLLNKRFIIYSPLKAFNFPDAKGILSKIFRVDFTQTSLAQNNELAAIAKAYTALQDPEGAIVVGLSRGASVASTFAARVAKGTINCTSPIKALVLESPFDSITGVINDRISVPWIRSLVLSMIQAGIPFSKYSINGPQPINEIDTIPADMPILLICSQEDATVPATSTLRLYKKLRATGHYNTHILMLKKGAHAKLLHGAEGQVYHNVTHAFYAQYGLPHEAVAAAQGKDGFALCQPEYASEIVPASLPIPAKKLQ